MSRYNAQEVIAPAGYYTEGDTVAEVLAKLEPMITLFLDDGDHTKWVNVGFSDDGVTKSSIAIGNNG